MKKILMFLCLGTLLTSCYKEKPKVTETTRVNEKEFELGNYFTPLRILEIDSCEYLYGEWGNATVLTHKGNCKNCKKQIK